jgi:hypothetical protein
MPEGSNRITQVLLGFGLGAALVGLVGVGIWLAICRVNGSSHLVGVGGNTSYGLPFDCPSGKGNAWKVGFEATVNSLPFNLATYSAVVCQGDTVAWQAPQKAFTSGFEILFQATNNPFRPGNDNNTCYIPSGETGDTCFSTNPSGTFMSTSPVAIPNTPGIFKYNICAPSCDPTTSPTVADPHVIIMGP